FVVLVGPAGLIPEIRTDISGEKEPAVTDPINLPAREQAEALQARQHPGGIFRCTIDHMAGTAAVFEKRLFDLSGRLLAEIAFAAAEINWSRGTASDFVEDSAEVAAVMYCHHVTFGYGWMSSGAGDTDEPPEEAVACRPET